MNLIYLLNENYIWKVISSKIEAGEMAFYEDCAQKV